MNIKHAFTNALRGLAQAISPIDTPPTKKKEKRWPAIFGNQRSGFFASAQNNRLTADLTNQVTSSNHEMRYEVRTLRARSRQLARDNDYFKGFLDDLENQVVGDEGINLQVRAKKSDSTLKGKAALDKLTNETVEVAWRKFCCGENLSVDGKLSMVDVQSLAMRTVAVDGECFIRKWSMGPHHIQLEFIDTDWLDEEYNGLPFNGKFDNGNVVIMSIEYNRFGRAVAYYLTAPRYDWLARMEPQGETYRERVPAENMVHLYLPKRVKQGRGLPWSHTILTRLQMLAGYEEAELVGQRTAAARMAFIKTPEGDEMADDLDDETQEITNEVEPGLVQVLPPGYELQSWTPTAPSGNYMAYVKTILRAVASGLGVSYNTLANDLESVSYSSIRAGILKERDQWRKHQRWLCRWFLTPLYKEWLALNVASSNLSIPFSKYAKVEEPTWHPRGYAWVDPKNDAEADVIAIENGLASRTQIVAGQGRDFTDVLEELAEEQNLADELGVKLNANEQQGLEKSADGKLPGKDNNQPGGKPKD